MAIAVESHNHNSAIDGTATISITASNAGDVVIVAFTAGTKFPNANVPNLGLSGAGLTWTLVGMAGGAQSGVALAGTTGVWWALTTGAASGTVTGTADQPIGAATLVYATFSGVQAPYLDPNAALPIQYSHGTPSAPVSGSYSTSYSPDLLLAFPCSGVASMTWTNPTSPPGSVIVDTVTVSNAPTGSETATGLMTVPVTTPQTATTYGSNINDTNFNFIGCALVGGGRQLFLNPGPI